MSGPAPSFDGLLDDLLKETVAAKAKRPMRASGDFSIQPPVPREPVPQYQWFDRAVVALHVHHNCTTCGTQTTLLEGFFTEQISNRLEITRLQRRPGRPSEFDDRHLPRETRFVEYNVPECAFCLKEF